ncbi:MAG: ATPase, T2SS/T4P/T4SS family [Anaerovoracaceae bacterium]
MEREFFLDKFLDNETKASRGNVDNLEERFKDICKIVEDAFDKDWDETDDGAKNRKLEREKRAIMGFEIEMDFYKEKIKEMLREKRLLNEWFPPWYTNICEAIFAELYGLSGLAPWAYDMTEEYKKSSSAKLIGENLYCLIDGKSVLQPQKIYRRRREQLKRTMLLATPYERLEYGFHEVYLHNGIRITIFSGDRTKKDQDVMVLRKYVLKDLTFEEMVLKKTIPFEAIDLFRTMIDIGFNVIFAGQVRSGKTTFLQTWQRYEDKTLEGLAIATDPETPWHILMPDVPIMQLVADGDDLEKIVKSLLRGDNDYVLLEEMRDAVAYNLALDITSTGTQRSKATIHDNDAINIPYKMGVKIRSKYGGDLNGIIGQVYRNFNYVFEFCQLPENKDRKVLKGIVEYRYDAESDQVSAHRICKYDFIKNQWFWKYDIGTDKEALAIDNGEKLEKMKCLLRRLEGKNPLTGNQITIPAYYHSVNREVSLV